AHDNLEQFRREKAAVQTLLLARLGDPEHLEQGLAQCRRALARYAVLEDPSWQQALAAQPLPPAAREQIREDVAELLWLLAQGTLAQAARAPGPAGREGAFRDALQWNGLAEGCSETAAASPALWEQRAELVGLLGRKDEAERLRSRAKVMPLRTARDHYWSAAEQFVQGHERAARERLQRAVQLDPGSFRSWFLLGRCHEVRGRHPEAAHCYTTCIALRPASAWAHFQRGLARLRLRQFRPAAQDFDEALRLQPGL